MPSIIDTRNQMIQFVFPEHANNLGTLHGGRLMDWIMLAGSITSSRIAKGITVLGASDSIDFINPIKVGDIVVIDSWVEYIGNTSMELGIRVHSENLETGMRKLTTTSHLAFIAVDKDGKPRTVPNKINPSDRMEEEIYHEAQKRKDSRLSEISKLNNIKKNIVDDTVETRFKLETTKAVLPEDTFYGNFMSVGKLMKDIDEIAAILAIRFARGVMVTVSVDDLYFYSPIRVGDIIMLKAELIYVGNTSLVIGLKVFSEDSNTFERRYTCTAFLNFVHLDDSGKPKHLPKYTPDTPIEIMLWKEAAARKERRTNRVNNIKKFAYDYIPQ
ncbi:MAG: acyl-CoA thioesterase [Thermodesulfobacteriota bacterium]